MQVVWDEDKNRTNQKKHHVSFEVAQHVFDDPLHVSRQDRIEGGEQRWQTVGLVSNVALLLVAHTVTEADGGITIRIISARKANKMERRIYEQSA